MKKTDGYWKIMLFVLLMAAAAPLFADGLSDLGLGGMDKLGTSIKEIFTGSLMRTILIICLAGCAIAYGFNKDNEKIKRNIIAIAIAIGILVAAQSIVEKVWGGDAAKTS